MGLVVAVGLGVSVELAVALVSPESFGHCVKQFCLERRAKPSGVSALCFASSRKRKIRQMFALKRKHKDPKKGALGNAGGGVGGALTSRREPWHLTLT